MINWKTPALRAINRMSPNEAQDWLIHYAQQPISIYQESVRVLTGGYNSQSINNIVIRMVHQRSKGNRVTRRLMGI